MLIKEEFLGRIRKIFDLNLYEAKVWTALLSRGVSTAGELSNISDVPRSRTYDVLESLEKRGYAITKIGKPVKYISVKPVEILEKIKSNAMNDFLKSTRTYFLPGALTKNTLLTVKHSMKRLHTQ